MRDPNRIGPTLEVIRQLWEKYPDWRLGQLVFNLAGRDPFYIEDDELVRKATEYDAWAAEHDA